MDEVSHSFQKNSQGIQNEGFAQVSHRHFSFFISSIFTLLAYIPLAHFYTVVEREP
jgi:hypothetical protein